MRNSLMQLRWLLFDVHLSELISIALFKRRWLLTPRVGRGGVLLFNVQILVLSLVPHVLCILIRGFRHVLGLELSCRTFCG